jgi:hypothetical protein
VHAVVMRIETMSSEFHADEKPIDKNQQDL